MVANLWTNFAAKMVAKTLNHKQANNGMGGSGGRSKPPTTEEILRFQQETKFKVDPRFRHFIHLEPPLSHCVNVNIIYYIWDNAQKLQQEELINSASNGSEKDLERTRQRPAIRNSSARTKYTRDLTEILESVTNIVYVKNTQFIPELPFNAQYYRYELDEDEEIMPDTKCGLCPYCENTTFHCLRNGGYGNHLMLCHGIYANNYLTPEGLNYGDYILQFGKIGNLIARYGFECPACHEIIRVGKKRKELLPYFRHWRETHRQVDMSSREYYR